MTTCVETFPPASYRQLCNMRNRGLGYRATSCGIPGCDYLEWGADDKPWSAQFTWDHCHLHDFVRGMLCRWHNRLLAPWERHNHWVLKDGWHEEERQELLVWFARCPECGPWKPLMVWTRPKTPHQLRLEGVDLGASDIPA